MSQLKKNKAFIIEYFNALSGQEKTREKLEKYCADPRLINYVMFIDSVFPKYEVYVEELLAEDDKVIVRVRFRGMHEGELMGFPPTHKWVEYPFVVRYQIMNNKIVHSWVIADNLVLAEAVGMKGIPPKTKI
ncbi:MAG: ester cyclase [Cyclobacteriaceae bacterium]|nr:ester cyclase [Cyclobacteriaceae bacterium]